VGPVLLERKIEEVHGIHIPHNTIYHVLREYGCIEVNARKRKQRKWVQFEREHSMSLWQGDWKQVTIGGQVKWLIAFMDDSSRLITCHGIFNSPTTENTILVLQMGFAQYGIPREILTDHGTQFVSARDRNNASHTFKDFLDSHGIKHIIARIRHPRQTVRSNDSLVKNNHVFRDLDQLTRLLSGIMRLNRTQVSIMMNHIMHSGIDYLPNEFWVM
jgi:putative transposase